VGEAKRRRQLRQDWPQVEPPGKRLTDQQQTAALLMYLFAILTWHPGPDADDDDERWTTYCMNKYAYHRDQNSLEACVWWAMRHENSPSLRDKRLARLPGPRLPKPRHPGALI
jgi:hypothetical protein